MLLNIRWGMLVPGSSILPFKKIVYKSLAIKGYYRTLVTDLNLDLFLW